MSKAGMAAAVAALLLAAGAISAQDRREIDRNDADRPGTERPVPEQPSPERRDDATRIAGEWSGTYTCVQGVTAMRLVIAPGGGRNVTALMHFFAAPGNPDVPEGCFTLIGKFDRATGDIDLSQERWIVRPANYRMIDLDGEVDRDGKLLGGRVIGPAGCTKFSLTREKPPQPLPEACAKAVR